MSADNASPSASDVARDLAVALDARGQDYALGGAIALGFWGEPRGTLDVDVTLFLPPDKPAECLWLLQVPDIPFNEDISQNKFGASSPSSAIALGA